MALWGGGRGGGKGGGGGSCPVLNMDVRDRLLLAAAKLVT